MKNGPGEEGIDNTIKLGKDDIIIGGQANPSVKITKQGKQIRIGQSSQINAIQVKGGDNP